LLEVSKVRKRQRCRGLASALARFHDVLTELLKLRVKLRGDERVGRVLQGACAVTYSTIYVTVTIYAPVELTFSVSNVLVTIYLSVKHTFSSRVLECACAVTYSTI